MEALRRSYSHDVHADAKGKLWFFVCFNNILPGHISISILFTSCLYLYAFSLQSIDKEKSNMLISLDLYLLLHPPSVHSL